jgi:hypothetical protein
VSEPSPLVSIRCKKCGRELASLDAMPDDWSGRITVSRCIKCVLPTPERIVDVLKRQNATTGFALLVEIPLSQLRDDALKAQRRGRTVRFQIPPIIAASW